MRTSVSRLAVCTAALLLAGLAVPSSAAPAAGPKTVSFTDPAGDDKISKTSDIVKVTYTTQGTTAKVGKKTTYTPKRVAISVEVAGAIAGDGTVQYDVEGNVPGCGDFYLYASPGSELDPLGSSCGDDDTIEFSSAAYEVKGSTITFTVPLKSVPGFEVGKVISALNAYTGTVEPVTGEGGAVLLGSSPLENDGAGTDATYTIG